MTLWNGQLKVVGNKIRWFTPINFWNPQQPLEQVGRNQLHWKSITTGGVTGAIIELEKPAAGTLEINTLQKNCKCNVKSIGLSPKTCKAGGLNKQIQIYRLPAKTKASAQFEFTVPLSKLQPGDNPIYIRLTQEDGHMAWSSPIYLVTS